jgi:ubiquinone/menaquinone biosynthesis C-methylase UbiE
VGLHAALRENAAKAGLEEVYENVPCGAEDLNIAKESVDTVVCCKVLCSVPEQERVLRELYSFVKPGGQFIIYEHVASSTVGSLQSM